MVIQSIKFSRIKDRVYLHLSTGLILPLLVDDVIVYQLQKDKTIDSDLYSKLIDSSISYLLSSYAYRQLALSPKTAKIIRQKLTKYFDFIFKKYNYPSNLIDKQSIISTVIANLVEKKYLDDFQYVIYFLKKYRHKPRRFLEFNLNRNGIDVAAYLTYLPHPDSETDSVKTIIAKKYSKFNLSFFKDKNKVISALYRKGFSLTSIKAAVDDILKSR